MDMHTQSPVDSIYSALELRLTIRLWFWGSWTGLLIGAFGLLMLPPAYVSLPFPLVIHLILMSTPLLLLLLSRGAWLDRAARNRSLLTFATTAIGIELFCTLITIFWRATFSIVTDEPMPDLVFLFTHRHDLIGGAALFMLLYAFLHGPVLSGDSSDAARRPAVLLHLYIITRLLVAFGLGLPLEHPALAYSTAAALPLGLGAACLSNRFRPRPESPPPAPGS